MASVAPTQSTGWKELNDAGQAAQGRGQYAEAEKLLLAALKQAESFSETDDRLATSLNNLALLYSAQGKHAEAEPLYRRSLAIWEKTLGPEHTSVAAGLTNLSDLYRAQGKYKDDEPPCRRALAIICLSG
jgi:tetratricopeptide (TPR) repeat protein